MQLRLKFAVKIVVKQTALLLSKHAVPITTSRTEFFTVAGSKYIRYYIYYTLVYQFIQLQISPNIFLIYERTPNV